MTIVLRSLYGSETWTLRKYERDQLEGSHDQRICVRSSKREKKAFKFYIRKEKAMAWTHLERRKSEGV